MQGWARSFLLAARAKPFLLNSPLEMYAHNCTFTQGAIQGDASTKPLGGVFGDGEAQAGAAGCPSVALVNPVEPFKDPCLVLLGDSDAGILYRHAGLANGDGHLTTVLVIADGIVAQIIDQFIGELTDTRNDIVFSQQPYGDVPLICRRKQGSQDL